MKPSLIKAEVIADSISPLGHRLTTFVIRFPRIVLAEVNTHRAFSRNSSSSRAIPFAKMIEMVKNDPFIPIKFQKDHKGMQGTEYFEGKEHDDCVADWLNARDKAVESAESFTHQVTKQLRNRILEPFMWHTAIVSATEFENFFALRAHKDAEIHIAELANVMLEEYNKSTPKKLLIGQWHIPFGDKFDESRIFDIVDQIVVKTTQNLHVKDIDVPKLFTNTLIDVKTKIAIARCARVSYMNFEGKDDYVQDIKTCDKLFGAIPRHLSPTEHVAMATDFSDQIGNFVGFKQYRKFFEDENLKDSRVIKK